MYDDWSAEPETAVEQVAVKLASILAVGFGHNTSSILVWTAQVLIYRRVCGYFSRSPQVYSI